MDKSSSGDLGDTAKVRQWIDQRFVDVLNGDAPLNYDLDYCQRLLREGNIHQLAMHSHGAVPCEAPDEIVSKSQSHGSKASARFTENGLLGVGGFGIVFAADDKVLGIPVAVKFLRPSRSDSRELRGRFLGEARTTASLSHPGIVRIYDMGQIDSQLFMTTAHIAGGSLARSLDQDRHRFTIKQAAWFMFQVAEAVSYAHSMLTLHRDLKPANILLEPFDLNQSEQLGFRPVLTDFGLAKQITSEKTVADWTGDGQVIGTTRYMSPEQARGESQAIGTSSDIFSLGIILYETVVGHPPFQGKNSHEVRQRILNAQLTRPRSIDRSIPRNMEAIMLKCLAQEPVQRYATAHELVLDLQRFLDGNPVLAERSTWLRRATYTVRRHPVATAIGTATVLANFGAIVGMGLSIQNFRSALSIEKESRQLAQQANKETAVARASQKGALLNITKLYTDIADKIIAGQPVEVPEMIPSFTTTIESLNQLDIEQREELGIAHRLSVVKHYLSIAYHRIGDWESSIRVREDVIEIVDRLLKVDPLNATYRFDKFYSLMTLAELFHYSKSTEDSESAILAKVYVQQALEQIDLLCTEFTNKTEYADAKIACKRLYANIVRNHDTELSLSFYDETIEESTQLWLANRDHPNLAKHAIVGLMEKAQTLMDNKQVEKAIRTGQHAIDLHAQVRRPLQDETGVLSEATMIFGAWRDLLLLAERWGQALPVVEEIETIDKLLLSRELNDTFKKERFVNRLKHWQVLMHLGQEESAEAISHQIESLLDEWSDRPAFLKDLRLLYEDDWKPILVDERMNRF